MQNRRATILMGILFVLLGGYFLVHFYEPEKSEATYYHHGKPVPPPLPGENSLSNIKISKNQDDNYEITFDYYYTGYPIDARLGVIAVTDDSSTSLPLNMMNFAERGKKSKTIVLENPLFTGNKPRISHFVKVSMVAAGQNVTSIFEPLVVEWKSPYEISLEKRYENSSVEELYRESVDLIDVGDSGSLVIAKRNLEKLIEKNANFAPAYLEFARISMKSNWSAEGLSQAEQYILSAQKLDPENADVYVLLGYVYVHQKKYPEAEVQFNKAASIGTQNLWLWANWGELYAKQKKNDMALSKYLKAIDGARSYNTYDRARLDAYRNVINLFKLNNNTGELDRLYAKRASEFNNTPCFLMEYARFKLDILASYQEGASLAQDALGKGCDSETAKKTLGLSLYIMWGSKGGEDSLAKAKVYYPVGPDLLYELTAFDANTKLIQKLVKSNVNIDTKDADGHTALVKAIVKDDISAVSILIDNGASLEVLVGPNQFPISLVPVSLKNEEIVKIFRKKGFDYSKLKYEGLSGVEYAKQYSTPAIVSLIDRKKI